MKEGEGHAKHAAPWLLSLNTTLSHGSIVLTVGPSPCTERPRLSFYHVWNEGLAESPACSRQPFNSVEGLSVAGALPSQPALIFKRSFLNTSGHKGPDLCWWDPPLTPALGLLCLPSHPSPASQSLFSWDSSPTLQGALG